MAHVDTAVIGAGLAGLRAATALAMAGREVVVLDAADAVGGRQRTDRVDGFLLDRGFQVLNPAYPAIRRWANAQALGIRSFPAGVAVRRAHGVEIVADPRREPALAVATLRSGLVTAREVGALARWANTALAAPRRAARPREGADTDTVTAWRRTGVDGPLRREVLQPFLSGVIADDGSHTSDAFVRLLVRSFAVGSPGLPREGIQALPTQLAALARAAGADIRLANRVSAVDAAGSVAIDGAESLSADAVIVAVGPDAVADLVDVAPPATRRLVTWWFAADEAPSSSALLRVDGRGSGRVANTAVVTNTQPSYAPAGRHLVEATVVAPPAADLPSEEQVRRELAEIWLNDAVRDAASWQLLRRDDISAALPAQPPLLRFDRSTHLTGRIWLAGDHRETASIQGALVSGERAARAVLAR